MGDADKTAIIGAPPAGYGYADEQWDDDEEAARRRRRRVITILAVVGALLLAGAVALAVALSGDDEEPPPAVAQVAVPAVVGQQQAAAEQLLEEARLEVGDITPRTTDDEAQVGTVLESTPAPGAEVEEGTAVDLVVGAAPDTVAVPPVVGLGLDDARTALTNAGFTGSVNTQQVDSAQPEGTVVAVDPERGTTVPPDTAITLSVSDGSVEVPDVRGSSRADAVALLRDAGLTNITEQNVESETVPEGQAVGTEPGAGSQAGADDEIVLLIAVPVPPEPTPTTSAPATSSAPTTPPSQSPTATATTSTPAGG